MWRGRIVRGCFVTGCVALLWSAHGGATTQPAERMPHVVELPQPDENGVRHWRSYEQMHDYFVDGFVNSEGAGLSRMPTPRQMARWSLFYMEGTDYGIGNVQLVSLNKGEKPFAYDTRGDASMKSIHGAKHRSLSQQELRAVGQLNAGRDAVLAGNQDGPLIVGAVRATASCLECHQVKEGEMLGAFVYRLVPREQDAPRQKSKSKG